MLEYKERFYCKIIIIIIIKEKQNKEINKTNSMATAREIMKYIFW